MSAADAVAEDAFAAQVAAWMEHWRLRPDGPPRDAFGVCLRPVLAQAADGSLRAAMLKLVDAGSDERRAGELLQRWRGCGAVDVLAWSGDALLMERACPGRSLAECLDDDDDDRATDTLIAAMRALHACDVAWTAAPLPTVEAWGAGFDRYLAGTPHTLLPAARVADARERYFALCEGQAARQVLHGDFHHGNLLFDAARGWRVIDPKGIVGEPAYEAGALLRNPFGEAERYADPHVMAHRAERVAAGLGVQAARVLAWGETQAVLSAVWFAEEAYGGADTIAAEIHDALRAADTARRLLDMRS